jgi:hypothetical protein
MVVHVGQRVETLTRDVCRIVLTKVLIGHNAIEQLAAQHQLEHEEDLFAAHVRLRVCTIASISKSNNSGAAHRPLSLQSSRDDSARA